MPEVYGRVAMSGRYGVHQRSLTSSNAARQAQLVDQIRQVARSAQVDLSHVAVQTQLNQAILRAGSDVPGRSSGPFGQLAANGRCRALSLA